MKRTDFLLIFSAVVLTFATLYAPQPLLPVLAIDLGVTRSAAALLVSITLMPLAVAPIVYGLILQSVSAKRMLVVALAGLSVTSVMLAQVQGYGLFLVLRGVQGLILPAMMTALMTYVSATVKPEHMARAMAAYVATTVAGGFLGRTFSGQVSEWLGWPGMFETLAVLLAITGLAMTRLQGEPRAGFGRVRLRVLGPLLATPGLVHAYLTIFCAFFVFASLLNFLPFHLTTLDDTMGPGRISLMYAGYLMGIVVALASGPMTRVAGSQGRLVIWGLWLYLGATLLFLIPSVPGLFLAMFVFCAGMFTVHGVLPGLVNRLAPEHKGVVNGLYLCAYYLGGALGAWLPGYLLALGGWLPFVLSLAGVLVVALVVMYRQPVKAK